MRGNRSGTGIGAGLAIWLGLQALAGAPAAAQTDIVVVDDTLFDAFYSGQNPGCGGCGLRDWDDAFNTSWACRELPGGGLGMSCSGATAATGEEWDDANLLNGSLQINGDVSNRWDGLVTEFDEPDDPFPPYDPAASGAILSLTGTYSLRHRGSTDDISNTIEGHLLIQQGSAFYISDHFVGAPSGGGLGPWVRVGESSGTPIVFMADDFGLVVSGQPPDTSQHPDFSASGAPLFFGFALDMSYSGPLGGPPGNNFLIRSFYVDDVEFTVTSAGVAPTVPALAPLGLGVLGVALVAARLAHRRRTGR
jgi:hypothetical protein